RLGSPCRHGADRDRQHGEVAPGQSVAAGVGRSASLGWFGHVVSSSPDLLEAGCTENLVKTSARRVKSTWNAARKRRWVLARDSRRSLRPTRRRAWHRE